MKIATFNINDINKRLPHLLGWLRTAKPDVVCLQELNSTDDAFPKEAVEQAGYRAVFRGQKSWNGVAILVGLGEPVLTRTALPGDPADTQSRYIEAAVNGVLVGTLCAPLLSRIAKDHPAARRKTSRRDSRFCQSPSASLPRGTAACGGRRLGHSRSPNL